MLDLPPSVLQKRFGESVAVQGTEILVGEGVGDDVWMFKQQGSGTSAVWNRTHAFGLGGLFPFGDRGARMARSGEHVIVGMPSQGSPPFPLDVGAVEFFERTSTNPDVWQQRGAFSEVAGQPDARFGAAVDIDGDFAIVGSPGFDQSLPAPAGVDSGKAWIYRRVQGAWVLETALPPTTQPALGSS